MKTMYPLLFLVLSLFAQSVSAMNVTIEREENLQFILLTGRISRGDAERVAKVVIDFEKKNGYLLQAFRIDSAGGDVTEAIKIAKLIRGLYGSVKVVNDRYCASSCFLIWLNGAVRMASGVDEKSDGGMLVIHRPYFGNAQMDGVGDEALGQRQVETMKTMRAYLEDNLVPRVLIDEMLSRPSNDGYLLNSKDIMMLGELPPWFEEVSIAKCNYRRGLVDEIVAAKVRGNLDEAQRLRFLDDSIIECEHELRNKSGSAYLKRLSTGWRPW